MKCLIGIHKWSRWIIIHPEFEVCYCIKCGHTRSRPHESGKYTKVQDAIDESL